MDNQYCHRVLASYVYSRKGADIVLSFTTFSVIITLRYSFRKNSHHEMVIGVAISTHLQPDILNWNIPFFINQNMIRLIFSTTQVFLWICFLGQQVLLTINKVFGSCKMYNYTAVNKARGTTCPATPTPTSQWWRSSVTARLCPTSVLCPSVSFGFQPLSAELNVSNKTNKLMFTWETARISSTPISSIPMTVFKDRYWPTLTTSIRISSATPSTIFPSLFSFFLVFIYGVRFFSFFFSFVFRYFFRIFWFCSF